MPYLPDSHLRVAVRTAQGVAPHAPLIALAVGQRRDDLDRPSDDALYLGQGLLNETFEFGKGLRRLHPVIAYPLEAFGKRMLHLCGEVNYVARRAYGAIPPYYWDKLRHNS